MLLKAKQSMYNRWKREQVFVTTRKKCEDYGKNETMDTLWDKLPEVSKQYWLNKVASYV